MPESRKIVSRVIKDSQVNTYVGKQGELFYDPTSPSLYISDGSTPGGVTITGGGGGAFGYCCTTNITSVCLTSHPNIGVYAANNFFAGCNAGLCVTSATNNAFIGFEAGKYANDGDNSFLFGYQAGYCSGGYFNNFLGYRAGYCTPSYMGSNNFFGNCAGYYNESYNNNFFGWWSGRYNVIGGDNNFFGSCSGEDNVSGFGNNFIGHAAGRGNYNGSYNNFIGAFAGYGNYSNGSHNNFFGSGSGSSNTTGSHNIFMGNNSGVNNSTGVDNIFMGRSAGYCNTTGLGNIFLNTYAGWKNISGSFNTFIGGDAGCSNTTGSYNNFFGNYSGRDNISGCRNIFLGSYSGISTSASTKVIVGTGYYSCLFDSPDTTKDTQFAVGVRTDTNPSKYWLVGDENFNVGIGVTNPTTKLEVGGTVTASLFTGDGSGLTNIVATGSGVEIKDDGSPVGTAATIDFGANLTVTIGSGIATITASGGGGSSQWITTNAGIHTLSNVGIGVTNPTTRLEINGTLGFSTFSNSYGDVFNNTIIGDNTTGANLVPDPENYNGISNIFIGVGAGSSTVNGSGNNFFGSGTGHYNTYGRYNNFFGGYGGYNNTTGNYNNFFGFASGGLNSSGSYNNFLGQFSGYNNTIGVANNFIGHRAGFYNNIGSNNIFLGSVVGWSTSASLKVIIGHGFNASQPFDAPNIQKDCQLAIGIRNFFNQSNYWLVGDENFNVGIGVTNPTKKLQVGGDVKVGVNTSQGLVLTSPSGYEFRIVVSDSGVVTATAI